MNKSLQACIYIAFVFSCMLPYQAKSQFQLNGDATQIDSSCFLLTPDLTNQVGTVWNLNKVNISQAFNIYGRIYLGDKDALGADGIAFVLQQQSTNAGSSGLGIGYQNILPSIAIEFDTWQNNSLFDPEFDHIAIMRNGVARHNSTNNLAGPVQMLAGVDNLEDGNFHDVRINWDPFTETLEVYVDCERRLSYNGDLVQNPFNGDPFVFWGFTSATGARSNEHQFCLEYVSFTQSLEDVTICKGESFQINPGSGAGNAFRWEPTTGLNNPNIANPTATPDTTTTYFLTVTDICGNERLDTITIRVSEPIAEAGENDTICFGGNTLLQGTGGAAYSWSPTLGLNNPNVATVVASPSVSTTYTLTTTNGEGCTATDSVRVEVLALPPADAGADTAICFGDTATLGGSGGITYIWTPINDIQGVTTPNPVVFPSTSTIYTVSVVDTNGCANTDQVSITVNPLPVANAGADQAICFGDSVELSGSGGILFSWQPQEGISSANMANPRVSPASSTVYELTVTDANACSSSDEVSVTVFELPIAEAGQDTGICIGESLALTASGGTSYAWTPGAGLDNAGIADPVATPTTSTLYQLTVTDDNGCIDRDSIEVEVFALPPANAGADTAICFGDTASLFASGGIFYEWNPTALLDNASSRTPRATPTVSTIFRVVVTDTNGCVDSDELEITVNDLPPAEAGDDQAICFGETTGLLASGGISYQWQPDTSLNDGSIANPTASPLATTVYLVEVTDGNGCSQVDSMTLTILPLPNADAGTDQAICIGDTTQLQARGGISYSWQPQGGLSDAAIADPLANPTATTDYIVTVVDANACINTDTVNVLVNPLPFLEAGNDTSVCIGSSIVLQAQGTGEFRWELVPGISSLQTPNPSVNPTLDTWFVTTLTDSNGCRSTDSVFVFVNPLPVLSINNDTTICPGDPAFLFASGASTYAWSPADGLSASDIEDPLAVPAQTTLYEVVGTDDNGCQSSLQTVVNVRIIPDVVGQDAYEICQFESATLSVSGANAYLWSTGDSVDNIEVSPLQTTNYYVVPFEDVCPGDTFEIEVRVFDEFPVPQFVAEPEFGFFPLEVAFRNQSQFATSYVWDFGDGQSSDLESPVHTYDDPGEYIVTLIAENQFGCKDTVDFTSIKVLDANILIPNVFSPNGDGVNDNFTFLTGGLKEFSLFIYDRWGRLMFSSNQQNFQWDGRFNGTPAPEGVYLLSIRGITLRDELLNRDASLTLIR